MGHRIHQGQTVTQQLGYVCGYNNNKSLIFMKQQPPCPQLRLFLSNLCSTYQLSLQTYHNTMSILMNPKLPQLANQDKDVSMAALIISQKLHQKDAVSVRVLCDAGGLSLKAVLAMQVLVLKQLRYRVATPLLIDACLEIAYNWDLFVKQVTCMGVRFFTQQPQHNKQSYNQADKQNINISIKTNMNIIMNTNMTKLDKLQKTDPSSNGYPKYRTLQTCQKLVYRMQTREYQQCKLALAVVALCIKQAERHHYNTAKRGNRGKRIYNHKTNHQSTDIIISDFMRELHDIDYEHELKEEIKYVKLHNFGLKDISHRVNITIHLAHTRHRYLISKNNRH